jgi:hypothetical protein
MSAPIAQIMSMKGRKVSGTNKFIDLFLVYQFVKRIITPFNKWPAYELGIIDDKGKVLIKKSSLDTEASKAWGYFDIMCANLKKILGKLPGGQTRIASIAAAAFLFKEHREKDYTDAKLLEEDFTAFLSSEELRDFLGEDMVSSVPANAIQASGGATAIDTFDPLLLRGGTRKKKKPEILSRKLKLK